MMERLQHRRDESKWLLIMNIIGLLVATLVDIVTVVFGQEGMISFFSRSEITYSVLSTYKASVETLPEALIVSVSGVSVANKGNVQEENLIVEIVAEDAVIQGLAPQNFAIMPTLQSGGIGYDYVTYSFDKPVNPGESGTIYVTTNKPATLSTDIQYSRGTATQQDVCPTPPPLAHLLEFLGVAWIVNLICSLLFWRWRKRIYKRKGH